MSKTPWVFLFVSLAIIVKAAELTKNEETAFYDPGDTKHSCIQGSWYVVEASTEINEGVICKKVDYAYHAGILNYTAMEIVGRTTTETKFKLRQINNSTVFVYKTEQGLDVIVGFLTDSLCKYILVRRYYNDVTEGKPVGSDDIFYILTKSPQFNKNEVDVMKARYTEGRMFHAIGQNGCDNY